MRKATNIANEWIYNSAAWKTILEDIAHLAFVCVAVRSREDVIGQEYVFEQLE